MCDASMIREYGLLGSFDTVVNMCGEQLALVTGWTLRVDDAEDAEDGRDDLEGELDNDGNVVEASGAEVEAEEDVSVAASQEEGDEEVVGSGGESEATMDDEDEEEEEDVEEDDEDSDPRSKYVYDGMMYHELQYHSQALSTMLHYRFGVRAEDRVLLLCEQEAAAEVIAMLTCMRLGAIFVPFDTLPLRQEGGNVVSSGAARSCTDRLQKIVADCQPTAAIVLASNDQDPIVLTLASMGLYKVALISPKGGLVDQDATVNSELLGSLEDFQPQIDFDTSEQTAEEGQDPQQHTYHALYILYTSGSTGESKGVIGTYEGLINRIAWYLDTYPYESSAYGSFRREGIVRRTPLTFVDSMAEIFAALLAGVPLIIQGDAAMTVSRKVNSMGLFCVLRDTYDLQGTRITLIPNMLYSFCQMVKSFLQDDDHTAADMTLDDFKRYFSAIRYIFVSGEECTKVLLDAYVDMVTALQLTAFPSLVNLYGSTEVAGDVTFLTLHSVSQAAAAQSWIDGGKVPLGHCMDGNVIVVCKKVTDQERQGWMVCAEGEAGELLVVGRHVAKGYFRNANPRYQHRFVSNPFISDKHKLNELSEGEQKTVVRYPGAYWTGDMGYFKWSGDAEKKEKMFYYLGREDREVKIRGMKVELDDVERRIKQLLNVDLGVVVMTVKDMEMVIDTESAVADRTHLVLVVNESLLPSDHDQATGKVLAFRILLTQHLPPAYIPDIILPMPESPAVSEEGNHRTSSLKINRQEMKLQVIDVLRDMTTASTKTAQSSSDVFSCGTFSESEGTLMVAMWRIFQHALPHTAQLSNKLEDIQAVSFFALGGDSLSAIEVLYQLRHSKEINSVLAGKGTSPVLTISELQHTIGELAKSLLEHKSGLPDLQKEVVEPASKRMKQEGTIPSSFHSVVRKRRVNKDEEVPIKCTAAIGRGGSTTSDINITLTNSAEKLAEPHWKVKLLQCVDASPVLAASTSTTSAYAYIGSHGGDFLCIDTTSGEVRWSEEIHEHIEGQATVDLAHQTVLVTSYIATDIHLTGAMRCAHAEPTCKHVYYDDEYLQEGQVLTEITRTDSLGSLRTYNLSSGELMWCFHSVGEIKSSPLLHPIDVNVVYTACYNGFVYKLHRGTGCLLQSTRVEGSVFANPIVDASGSKVYIATTRGFVYCLSSEDLSECWVYDSETISIFSTPMLHPLRPDALVVCYTDGCIRCIKADPDTASCGKMSWEQGLSRGPFFSSLTLLPESVSSGSERFAVVGNHDGNLRVIRFTDVHADGDGECVLLISIGTVIFATPSVVFDTSSQQVHCVLATTSGTLYRVSFHSAALQPDQSTEDSDVEMVPVLRLAGEIFSSPVILGSKLFIGSRDDHLYCIPL